MGRAPRAVLLSALPRRLRAGRAGRRGVEALEVPLDGGKTLRLTISAGVCALDRFTVDPAALIQASDTALYEAKRAGKNRTMRGKPAAVAS